MCIYIYIYHISYAYVVSAALKTWHEYFQKCFKYLELENLTSWTQQPRRAYEDMIKYLRNRVTEVTNKHPDLKLEVNKGKLLAALNDETIQARVSNQLRQCVFSQTQPYSNCWLARDMLKLKVGRRTTSIALFRLKASFGNACRVCRPKIRTCGTSSVVLRSVVCSKK